MKRILRQRVLALFLLAVLSGSCNKSAEWIDGTIVDRGSPAVDGCGFLLEAKGKTYYPINLDERYQIDGKRVRVRFSITDEMYTCGFSHAGIKYQKINIRDIEDK